MSFEKLSANAEILVLAGSETTATLLSGCTYLLLTNPDKMEKLKHEVRSTFASESEITASAVNNLSYMLGVLNEALRLYPPVTSSLVRVVPPGGDMIADHWVPEGVSQSLVTLHQFRGLALTNDSEDHGRVPALVNEPQRGELGRSVGIQARKVPGGRTRKQAGGPASVQCRAP